MSHVELVAGGARSGKSRYALEQAEASGNNLVFVATARAGDGEMLDRIEKHRRERDERWALIEEPLDLARVLLEAGEDDCLLIDCLTLWITNWLCEEDSEGWQAQKEAFLQVLEKSKTRVILVTNEVGMGITPMGELSRQFVDESGWIHQAIAQIADRVTLVMFGLPQHLKESRS